MAEKITTKDLAALFASFVETAKAAGYEGTEHWQMSTGSKMNGNAFRAYAVIPPSTGHSELPHGLLPGSGFLGMTKREAWDRLQIMRNVLWSVIELRALPYGGDED